MNCFSELLTELRRFQRIACRKGVTLAEWVGRTLRRAAPGEPAVSVEEKLASVRAAVRHEFTVPDIEQMLSEIERGYVAGNGE